MYCWDLDIGPRWECLLFIILSMSLVFLFLLGSNHFLHLIGWVSPRAAPPSKNKPTYTPKIPNHHDEIVLNYLQYTFMDMTMYWFKSWIWGKWLWLLTQFNVFVLVVDVLSAITEIDDENLICFFLQADQKVLGTDISIDKFFGVYPLNPIENLFGYHKDSFQTEATPTEMHELFKWGSIDISDEASILIFYPVPVKFRESNYM